MNKLDRNAIAYINREHTRLIDKSSNYTNNYSNFELYLDHYIDIDNENLREIFAYFHESINRLIKLHSQSDYEYNEEDYRYAIQRIDNIFSEIRIFQNNLKDTKYAFKIYESYYKFITASNNHSYENLEIIEINPIFELLNNQDYTLDKKREN